MGVNFFFGKKTKPEGGLVKDHTFPAFFFCTLPLFDLLGKIFICTSVGGRLGGILILVALLIYFLRFNLI